MTFLRKKLPKKLLLIAKKCFSGRRLCIDEGLYLFAFSDLSFIQNLAAQISKNSTPPPVEKTLHIYPSNICILCCPLCRFYAKKDSRPAIQYTVKDLVEKVSCYHKKGVTQVHIVSGLDPSLSLSYYQELLQGIQEVSPSIKIKALSAVEYDFLAAQANIPVEKVLSLFKEWGCSFIPGGGAEIFDKKLRAKIAPRKISMKRYLEIHQYAHQLKIPSNCTMLYGHYEKPIHILTHIDALRQLQDKTGGFTTFLPLRFHSNGTNIIPTSTIDGERLYPIARLFFDNIETIGALWNYETKSSASHLTTMGVTFTGHHSFEEGVIGTMEHSF